MTVRYKKFTVTSTLEQLADFYTAETAQSEAFLTPSRADRRSFGFGYELNGVPQNVMAVEDGWVSEYEIRVSPAAVVTTVKGRDAGASALDTYFAKRYLRAPAAQVLQQASPVDPTAPAVVTGRFRAREIANEACAFAQVSLDWQVRDYELLEDFNAAGRVIDTLRRLVEPWAQIEPFRVDIYMRGTTVIVAQRTPFTADAGANTFGMAEARRTGLSVRIRPGRLIGHVTLLGAVGSLALDPSDDPDANIGQQFTPQDVVTIATHETFDAQDNQTGLIVIVTTTRMPDSHVLRIVKETYTYSDSVPPVPQLLSRETTENEYEASIYDRSGLVNDPKWLRQVVTHEDLTTDDSQTGAGTSGSASQAGGAGSLVSVDQTGVATAVLTDTDANRANLVTTLGLTSDDLATLGAYGFVQRGVVSVSLVSGNLIVNVAPTDSSTGSQLGGPLVANRIEHTQKDYDARGFLAMETVQKWVLDADTKQFVPTELHIRYFQDVDVLVVQEIVEQYTWVVDDTSVTYDSLDDFANSPIGRGFSAGDLTTLQQTGTVSQGSLTVTTASDGTGAITASSSQGHWALLTRDATTSGGHRPGGPGRRKALTATGVGQNNQPTGAPTQLKLERVIDTDRTAQPFTYENRNLQQADLDYLMDLLVQANDLWVHELTFSGVAMPWLMRGDLIQFSGIVLEDGAQYTTPVCTVIQVDTLYDESKRDAEYTQPSVRAWGWVPASQLA